MENENRNRSLGKDYISAEQAEVIKNKILGTGKEKSDMAAAISSLAEKLDAACDRIAFLESEPKSGISFEPGNVYGQMAASAEPVAWQSIDGTVTNFPWIREAWKKDGIEYIPLYADSSVFLDQPPLQLYGWHSIRGYTRDAEVVRQWGEGGVKYTTLFAYETGDDQPTDDAKRAPSTIVGLSIALEEACSAMRDACDKIRAFLPDEAEDLLIDVVSAVGRSVVAANAFNAALPDGGGA
jgi:hypothetical protein